MSRPSLSRRNRVLAVAVAAALLAGACGGSEEGAAEFAEGYRKATQDFQTRTESIKTAASAGGGSVESILSVYEDILESTRLATGEYAELKAPPSFEDTFAGVVTSLEGQVGALESLIESAQENDVAQTDQATRDLAQLMADWQAAVTEMNELLAACGECGE
ncbi:MAG: hypothetical protein M3277_06525 [Actinomycetota bacterium]|nr:hypothetical protein [Actinomycetota bacterium]